MKQNKLKLTILAMLLSVVSFAQNGRITASFSNIPLSKAIEIIERSVSYSFFYDSGKVDLSAKVSMSASELPVAEAMRQMLSQINVDFEIKGGQIVLIPAAASVQQMPTTLTLTILDRTEQPVIGAAVMKADGSGEITDIDGKCVVPLSASDKTLAVVCMGYQTKTLTVGTSSNMTVYLEEDNQLLTESVVVGYGVQKKVNLTGAVAAVDSKQLQDRPVASVGQALQGVVPNLNITNTSGRPGASSNFNIRGNTSPNGGTPLILVDGVETDLGRINSNDIASISVLKDASSAAIYGARGAFGVILVTTKSGDFDKAPTVTADARFSFSAPTTSTDYETRGYYHAKIADLFMETYSGVPYTNYTSYDYQRLWDRRNDVTEHPDRPWVLTEMRNGRLEYLYLANFDWYNYMYDESRPTQDYNVSVRGGSKNISYMVSGRYYHQDGIFRIGPDDYDSFNTRAKVDVKICPWLKLSSNTRFFHSKYHYAGNEYRRPTLHALASFVPVNPDGTYVSHTTLTQSASHYIMDGYSAMLHKGVQYGTQKITELTTSWILTADITEHLKFNVDFSYKFGYFRSPYRDATVQYSQYPGEVTTEATLYIDQYADTVNERNDYVSNAYMSYANTWKNDHDFTGTVGVNYEARTYNDLSVRRQDMLTEELNDFNLAYGNVDKLTGGINEYALAGLFYRFTYAWKSRYLFETNGRLDGSSRFPKGNQWGFFPSVSAAWRLSEEPWMANVKDVMNNAKLRVSYGSLGNQNIGYYDYYQTVDTNGLLSYTFDGSTKGQYAYVTDPVSTGTWETVTTFDVGTDLGFLKDKLTFSADFYIRNTKGILAVGKQLPSIYGAGEPKVNANDIRTTGWEIQFEWRDGFDIGTERFDYSIGGSLADYTAVYTKADNPDGIIWSPYVGMRLGEIWGYRTGGLFASDEEAAKYVSEIDCSKIYTEYMNCTSEYGKGVRAGDLKILDVDGNGVLDWGSDTINDHGDTEILGNSQPRFSYGFNAGFNYFGFDFSIFFQGIGHMDWYPGNDNQRFWGPYSRPYSSFIGRDFMSDVWSETNPDAYFPRPRGYTANWGMLNGKNDRYLQNLAYLRLKNLSIGYTFPEKWMSKAKISKMRVYFSGENLWYWSALHSKYLDPEMAISNTQSNTYSFCKTFSFGLSMEF